jgi:hypothetical protein
MRVSGHPTRLLLLGGLLTLVPLPATAQGTSLRFFGNGVAAPDLDRVKVRIDAPARPADIGATDFTIELWMKASAAENTSGPCSSGGDAWINGNILMDRDVFGGGDYGDYGVALYGGRIAFGAATPNGSDTICSTASVANSVWHHVALTRRFSDGQMRIFVDGQIQAAVGSGPSGNASYRDGRATSYPNSDPFIVFGAEKHDAGAAYPSYSGWLDEVRLSTAIRYTASFTPPTQPFATDASTAALYHFDEGSGTTVNDSSGAPGGPSNGVLNFGGTPAGPLWSTDTPFVATPSVATSFYTVTPCRVVDTRGAPGPAGAPALIAGGVRTFPIGGRCGIPTTARAASANLAVTGPTAAGNLRLYPAGTTPPLASAINYSAGQTRANNAVVPLSAAGELDVGCSQASGTVHFILDVNGWFE